MSEKYDLSKQELFIMEILWENHSEMTLGEISELLQQRGFQPTIGTAKTYLTRLVKKGTLKTRKEGHKLFYSPASDERDYGKQWTQNFLSKHFHGSLSAFVCALTGAEHLSEKEIQQLKDLYDE